VTTSQCDINDDITEVVVDFAGKQCLRTIVMLVPAVEVRDEHGSVTPACVSIGRDGQGNRHTWLLPP
jgi:hypothetical protein